MEVLKMYVETSGVIGKPMASSESFNVQITNPMLYDRLHTLSVEYSISVEQLVNAAIRRLVADVDFVRGLRVGRVDGG